MSVDMSSPLFRTFVNILNKDSPLILYIDTGDKDILHMHYSANITFSLEISYTKFQGVISLEKFK
ncbi:MAG TPA: hypothetical protein VKR58_08165, partial [Aquella sp.]|nr:hypothetical protein [Aquella sp.]